MPLICDWDSSPRRITVPKAELSLIGGVSYQITVDYWWQLLRELNGSVEGIAETVHHPIYVNIPPTSSTPRIINVDAARYEVWVEDGLYSLNIVGGNTNWRDVEVKNQVSVGTNNTTGFINPIFLEQGLFSGAVTIDVINGYPGTDYTPEGAVIGTESAPSNNVPDAIVIANARSLSTLRISGDITLGSGDDVSGFSIEGQNIIRTLITLGDDAVVVNTEISDATITGTLDGDTIIRLCSIFDLNFFSGTIYDSQLNGTLTLGSSAMADLRGCSSGIPGQTAPTIDMGGSGQSLSMRAYTGGIKLINKAGADVVSIDLVSGQVQVDLTTVINGTIVVRGTGKVVDASNIEDWLPHGQYGNLYLDNETTYGRMVADLWTLEGLDPDVPVTITKTTRVAGDIDQAISGDGINTTTVQRA